MHIPSILPLDRTLVSPSAQRAIDRLQVGAILEVFSTTREGKRGLLINDQFLPADNKLPLPDGVRVKVRVQANDDKLILKLLPDRSAESPPSERFEGLLSKLTATPLMKEAIKSLRNALAHIEDGSETPPKTPLSENNLRLPLVLTPDKLGDPKKVLRLLEQLTEPQLFPQLKKSGEETKTPLPPSTRLLFLTIEEHLRTAAHALSSTPLPSPLSKKEVKDVAEELLKGLLRVKKEEILSEDAQEVLEGVQQELKEVLKGRGDEKETKRSLKRAAELVKNLLQEDKARERVEQERYGGIEEMLKGQELLSLLNPIVQEAGEPQLLLIPLALTGHVQIGEMAVRTPPHDVEEEKGGKKEEGERGTSLLLTLPFPTIGDVGVKVHYTSSQLYLTLTFAHDDVTRFAEAKLELLRKRLLELGFNQIELSARSGEIPSTPPLWTRELLGTDIIA